MTVVVDEVDMLGRSSRKEERYEPLSREEIYNLNANYSALHLS